MKKSMLKVFVFAVAVLSHLNSFSADNKFTNSLQECEILAVATAASKSSTLVWGAGALVCLVEKCSKITFEKITDYKVCQEILDQNWQMKRDSKRTLLNCNFFSGNKCPETIPDFYGCRFTATNSTFVSFFKNASRSEDLYSSANCYEVKNPRDCDSGSNPRVLNSFDTKHQKFICVKQEVVPAPAAKAPPVPPKIN